MASDNAAWGLGPQRENRLTVRLVLAVNALPPTRWKILNRGKRLLRDTLGLVLSSDVRCSQVGEGLHLPHPYGVVIHARARIGRRCTVFQGVTIGEDHARPGVPTIGDDVLIGAGAAILGPVTVGDGARIGANAVVVADVPAGAVAVGVPARHRPPGGRRSGQAPHAPA